MGYRRLAHRKSRGNLGLDPGALWLVAAVYMTSLTVFIGLLAWSRPNPLYSPVAHPQTQFGWNA